MAPALNAPKKGHSPEIEVKWMVKRSEFQLKQNMADLEKKGHSMMNYLKFSRATFTIKKSSRDGAWTIC